MSPTKGGLVPLERIEGRILLLRGQKVMVDSDLAELYDVPTKRLNEQVKRNSERFPEDFVFRLTTEEVETLNRSQFATGSQKHRDPRLAPSALTEHGAIMAANVLNSPRAVEMSVYVVRAFVHLREAIASNQALAAKLNELERQLKGHDQAIAGILDAIRELMAPPPTPKKRPIGFVTGEEKK
ncbi:MAG: ORF6N domain-containing protein [Proteobacteria bacterium]|nr:ORF6N domain-containing protein [Pseudomonadota bacterium]